MEGRRAEEACWVTVVTAEVKEATGVSPAVVRVEVVREMAKPEEATAAALWGAAALRVMEARETASRAAGMRAAAGRMA